MKQEKSTAYNILHKTLFCILISIGLIVTTGCIFMIIIRADANKIEKQLNNSLENEGSQEIEYISVEDIYAAPEKYIDTYSLVCGYFCKEFATDTGIAWLSDKKEASKDTEKYIIRLEQDEPFDYTPKAIAVYGKITFTEDKALVIKDGSFYLYGGTDVSMLKHNDLIDANIFDVVITSLTYDNNTDYCEQLETLQTIALQYEDTDLSKLLAEIMNLADSKTSLSQEDFEAKAEPLWNDIRAQLLDR